MGEGGEGVKRLTHLLPVKRIRGMIQALSVSSILRACFESHKQLDFTFHALTFSVVGNALKPHLFMWVFEFNLQKYIYNLTFIETMSCNQLTYVSHVLGYESKHRVKAFLNRLYEFHYPRETSKGFVSSVYCIKSY